MLRITGLPDGVGELVVQRGEVAAVAVADADALVAALAGLRPGGDAVVDGVDLSQAAAVERWQAGLAVVPGRPPLRYEGPLLDLVLLGDRRRPRALGVAIGSRRSRALVADAEAAARALAGRVGLARWLDVPVAAVPPEMLALADLARALLSAPRAVVVRRPDWLGSDGRALLDATLGREVPRLGAAGLWVDDALLPEGGV